MGKLRKGGWMRIRKIYTILIVILLTLFLTACDSNNEEIDLELSTKKTEAEISDKSLENGIYIQIIGEIESEGVYCVDNGTRLYQVIEKAGGFTKKAERDYLNLAETVYDGQKIQVLSKKEYKKQKDVTKESIIASDSDADLLNINTATVEQFTELPGIGTAKATAIVSYRDENGKFSSKEDIKNVSGIGDAIFANIESMITVN